MDGLSRNERRKAEAISEELYDNEDDSSQDEILKSPPNIERRSFLDKLTERVKDFLDNAE